MFGSGFNVTCFVFPLLLGGLVNPWASGHLSAFGPVFCLFGLRFASLFLLWNREIEALLFMHLVLDNMHVSLDRSAFL